MLAFVFALLALVIGGPARRVGSCVGALSAARRARARSGTSWRSWPRSGSRRDRGHDRARNPAPARGGAPRTTARRRGEPVAGHPAGRPAPRPRQRARPARTSNSTSSASATAGCRRACRTACEPWPCPRTSGSRRAGTPGAEVVDGDYIFFLDDDASHPVADVPARRDRDDRARSVASAWCSPGSSTRRAPRTLAAGCRASARATRSTRRRCSRSGKAPSLLPRAVFDAAVGGWGAPFFYAHEGIELAWRVWDAGRRDLVRGRPRGEPPRDRPGAAHRVLPAERPEPRVAGQAQPARGARPIYVGSWAVIQICAGGGTPADWRAWFGG